MNVWWPGLPLTTGSTNTQTWMPTSAVASGTVVERLVLVKSPVSSEGLINRVVP